MPEPLTGYINQLATSCGIYKARIVDVAEQMRLLGTQLGWEGLPNSGAQAKLVADALDDEADQWGTGTTSVQQKLILCLTWIDDNWAAGGVTMDDMLSAMLSATNEQLTTWMGITDAYKVAVWDAPFNAEYYAALARGFKVW